MSGQYCLFWAFIACAFTVSMGVCLYLISRDIIREIRTLVDEIRKLTEGKR